MGKVLANSLACYREIIHERKNLLGVPVVSQKKQIQLVPTRTWILSLALLGGLSIGVTVSWM